MGQTKIVMKRALRGLYAGRHIQFGNKISEDGGNKTRRSWKPNRQKKRLFSIGLDRYVNLDITTHALRLIDRAGGLDEYMLKLPLKELHSERLLYLRKRIAESYDKKTMLPPDLAKKIKAVMEWSIEQKKAKAQVVSEEEDHEEEQDKDQDLISESVDISQMFAKFNVQQPSEDSNAGLTGILPGRDKGHGIRGGRSGSKSDTSRPTPIPEEFPETLFS